MNKKKSALIGLLAAGLVLAGCANTETSDSGSDSVPLEESSSQVAGEVSESTDTGIVSSDEPASNEPAVSEDVSSDSTAGGDVPSSDSSASEDLGEFLTEIPLAMVGTWWGKDDITGNNAHVR